MIRNLLGLAIIFLLFACHSKDSTLKEAEKISTSVAGKFAPDGREELYKIHFLADGSSLTVFGETTSSDGKESLLTALKSLPVAAIDSIRVLPDPSLGGKNWALVTISVCNIRSGPGHDTEMISQAILGTPVCLLKKSGHWSYIQTPDHYLGWVDDDALLQTDQAGLTAWKNSKRTIYLPTIGSAFNPETKEPVTDLVAGSILKTVEITKTDIILEMPDGRKLAIPSKDGMDFDLWRNRPESSAETIIGTAKGLLGRPYLWGGTSTKGVDCSGFVKTVYFLNGIILARDASLQFRHGKFTNPQNGYTQLKSCDLIFFGRKAEGDRPAKATHVGLYLGDGAYINSSGYVRIKSFDPTQKDYSKARADNWLGGRTILGSEGVRGIVRVKDHPWY